MSSPRSNPFFAKISVTCSWHLLFILFRCLLGSNVCFLSFNRYFMWNSKQSHNIFTVFETENINKTWLWTWIPLSRLTKRSLNENSNTELNYSKWYKALQVCHPILFFKSLLPSVCSALSPLSCPFPPADLSLQVSLPTQSTEPTGTLVPH